MKLRQFLTFYWSSDHLKQLFESFLCFRLLYSVLPPSVANELRHKRPVPAKRYDNVTILFSGIVGFNAFCSKHASAEGAIKIVNLLNDIYTKFDILTDSRKNPYVYKVSDQHSGLHPVIIQAFQSPLQIYQHLLKIF